MMKRIGIVGAALYAVGTLWAADPAVTLNRVQQRYPWNGMVDIDYTVADVPVGSEANYYVRFKITENGQTHVLHEMLDSSTLCEASNGTYRVTWNSAGDDPTCRFFTKTANVQAELVFCGGDKSGLPYGEKYMIVDLSNGTTESAVVSQTYPVEERYYYGLAAATNEFNQAKYKTTHLVLRRVRAGTYTAGSPTTEMGHRTGTRGIGEEGGGAETQHKVVLEHDFLLGMFEVTQAQYEKVMGTNPSYCTTSAADDLPPAQRPVEQVSYEMIRGSTAGIASTQYGNFDRTAGGADSFLGRLERRSGVTFDLPSEAQWEYACRAGTTTATYVGDYPYAKNGTPAENAANQALADRISISVGTSGHSYGVGQKEPNAWGFYDIIGNVNEVCRDLLGELDNPGEAEASEEARYVANSKLCPSFRGGNWYDLANKGNHRAAYRQVYNNYTTKSSSLGFRLSRTLP